jgi:hypothetical protein
MVGVVRWQNKDVPFTWNGVNYLLKMASDLDFLEDNRVMKQWIGFSLFRNPLMVPLPLEQLPVIEGSPARHGPRSPPAASGNQTAEKMKFSTPDFSSIGGGAQPQAGSNAGSRMELYIRSVPWGALRVWFPVLWVEARSCTAGRYTCWGL